MANAADAVNDSSAVADEQPPAMTPTFGQQQRATTAAPATQAVKEASGPQEDEKPSFLDRAWSSITSPRAIPAVTTSSADLPPVLQAVMPPKEDRVAAGAGFSEGFRRLAGHFTAGAAAAPPELGGMGDQDTSQQLHQQNVQQAQQYNQKYGSDPDAQKGLMLSQAAIGLPFAVAAPLLAGSLAEGAGLPTLGRFLAGSAGEQTGGLGGLLGRFGSRATSGAIGGGAAGAGTADPSQPLLPQVGDAAINSAVLAPAIGVVTDVATEPAKRLRGTYVGGRLPDGSLPATTVGRADAAQILQDNGVTVTGSQVSRDPLSATVSASGGKLPGSGTGPFTSQQQQQFRGGAMRMMGEPDSTLATSQVMQDNHDRIGHLFDGAAQTDIPSVNLNANFSQLGNDMRLAPPSVTADLAPVLRNIGQTIQRNGGVLPGNFYQGYVQSGSALQRIAAGDTQSAPYAQQIIDALHDGMEKSATGQVLDDVKLGRQQTRAWYAINNAARANGDGSFNADQLHAATTSQQARFGNSRGTLDDYADAGKTILGTPPPPPSGAPTGSAAGLALALKVLNAVGGGAAAVGAPLTLPINRGFQAVNRGAGPAAINTIRGGGGSPISPTVQALQRALPALLAPSRPENFGP
jgi:hypothetical protein